jgi:hypothetical protein
MTPDTLSRGTFPCTLVRVRPDGAGHYTAEVVGLPEVQATAATHTEAVEQVRAILAEWLSRGQLVALAISPTTAPLKPPGWAKGDALEQEFLDDLARFRQEDLERTLREYEREDQGCPGTSSTPTT